jgi:transcriptional regulator with XRE-family HTH domain
MAERRRSVSGQLLTLRKEMGLSQAEVAARMGTSQSAVARFEAGDLDVRLSTVERYSTALGARLEWRIEHGEHGEQGERGGQGEHGEHGGHGEHTGPGRHG